MAKNNSLCYVKRFLNKLDVGKKHDSEESSYYEIEGLKIRLSNHAKKSVKESDKNDLNIMQPVNDSKQYVVMVRSSLAMMLLDFKGVKELVNSCLLLKRMDAFKVCKEESAEMQEHVKTMKLSEVDAMMFGNYLKSKYKWYNSDKISDYAKKYFKDRVNGMFATVAEMDSFLEGEFSKKMAETKDKRLSKTDMMKLFPH